MANKITRIFDLNLFSGSSELMRQALGGYFYDPESNGEIVFFGSDVGNVVEIEKIESTEVMVNTSDSILPKYTFGNRIFVNEANSNFISDENWRVFIVGGSYADQQFAGIYNNNVYADHFNDSPMPSVPRELVNTSEIPSLIVTTEYFNYDSRYQTKVQNVESITEIPNYYLLPIELFGSVVLDSAVNRVQYLEMKNYLTNSYVNTETSPDESQKNIFALKFRDLGPYGNGPGFRNDQANSDVQNYGADSDFQYLYSLMPFGNKIEFSQELLGGLFDDDEFFNEAIRDNNYQLKFLKTLKETFQGENRLRTSTANFAVNTLAPISTGTTFSKIEKTQTVPIKIVDALTMLLYSYRNPDSETNDISVIDSGSYVDQINCAFDTSGMYRYKNTEQTLSVLNDFVSIASRIPEFEDLTNAEKLFNQAKIPKLRQTLAFRIQKIGGAPTGDSNTQNTVQNIWLYNDLNSARNRIYFDSQVKYDTNYTYKIFKYDIVVGYKYQLSDISTTRQIATASVNELDYLTEKQYCLEFYDPFTKQTVPSIFEQGSIAGDKEEIESSISSLETELEESIIDTNGMINEVIDQFVQQITYEQFFSISPTARGGFYDFIAEQLLRDKLRLFLQDSASGLAGGAFILEKFFPYLTDERSYNGRFFQFTSLAKEYYNELSGIIADYEVSARIDTSLYENLLTKFGALDPFGLGPIEDGLASFVDQVIGFYEHFRTAFMDEFTWRTFTDNYEQRLYEEVVANVGAFLLNQFFAFISSQPDTDLSDFSDLRDQILTLNQQLEILNDLATTSQTNSTYPYLSEFNVNFEPSVKILEIPIETKNMRIVDHPPNDLVITPHHLLDQSNRLAFYCKYDTFSVNTMTYPPTLGPQDEQNRDAYLTGHDFLSVSKQTQESVSPARFIEVYRVTDKPTSYADFTNNLRKTIDLKMENGDIPGDHIFTEAVQTNKKYYYVFRPVNDNGVGGQLSPVFESELIDDGGYVYANFVQYSEDDLAVPPPKQPLTSFKKLINIMPNIQHLQLDTSAVTFASSSFSQMSDINLGTQAEDTLWDADKYFKIRLTSKKTGKKMDLNIVFKKDERK